MIYARIVLELLMTAVARVRRPVGPAVRSTTNWPRRGLFLGGGALALAVLSSPMWLTLLGFTGASDTEVGSTTAVEAARAVPFTAVGTVVEGAASRNDAGRSGQPAAGSLSAAGSTVGSDAIRTDGSRGVLVRAIQTGLSRAGCYDGAVNGYWSTKTRDGMKRLVERLDARLPVDQPDSALRALVEGNPAARCDGTAPSAVHAAAKPDASVGKTFSSGDTPAGDIALPMRKPLSDGMSRPSPIETATAEPRQVAPQQVSPMPVQPTSAATSATSTAGESVTAGALTAGLSGAAAVAAANAGRGPGEAAATKSEAVETRSDTGPGRKAAASGDNGEMKQVRKTTRRRTVTAFDNVSRNMNRNFRSLGRSLNALFR